MQPLFVATSTWFAYANRIADFDGRLVTSNFIFDETLSLCLYRLGHAAAERVGAVLLDPDTIDLIRVTPEDEQLAWTLFRQRADQRYSFTDCASFGLMRRLGIDTALALDEDFRAEGFRVVP